MSRWQVAGPSEYWLLASSPAYNYIIRYREICFTSETRYSLYWHDAHATESELISPFKVLRIFNSMTISLFQVADSWKMWVSVTNELVRAWKTLWVPSRGLPAVTNKKHEKPSIRQSVSGQDFENCTSWIHKVKLKWSCYRHGVAQRVWRGIALLFHDSGTRRGCVVSSTPRPLVTPEKDLVPIVQEAGWAPGPVWRGAENLAAHPTVFFSRLMPVLFTQNKPHPNLFWNLKADTTEEKNLNEGITKCLDTYYNSNSVRQHNCSHYTR